MISFLAPPSTTGSTYLKSPPRTTNLPPNGIAYFAELCTDNISLNVLSTTSKSDDGPLELHTTRLNWIFQSKWHALNLWK